ncbi:MAG: cbb3-type cytochrome c oxidase subunit 3 [Betaproteobacteria bacterium]|nr:cbb3-type cytochrome c oxidase subunit 3 [Betaproteobacteria bacterium]
MDVTTIVRIVSTVLGFLCFLGICAYAYSRGTAKKFDEAALIPFDDEDAPVNDASSPTPK